METRGTLEPESIEVGAQGTVLWEMQQLSVVNREKTNKRPKPRSGQNCEFIFSKYGNTLLVKIAFNYSRDRKGR